MFSVPSEVFSSQVESGWKARLLVVHERLRPGEQKKTARSALNPDNQLNSGNRAKAADRRPATHRRDVTGMSIRFSLYLA